jgi:hypothetical protein
MPPPQTGPTTKSAIVGYEFRADLNRHRSQIGIAYETAARVSFAAKVSENVPMTNTRLQD